MIDVILLLGGHDLASISHTATDIDLDVLRLDDLR